MLPDPSDGSDADSFVSLSRSLMEELTVREGPLRRSVIDEHMVVWQELQKEEATDHLLAFNMIRYGRGPPESGMLYWDGDGASHGQVERRLKKMAMAGQGRILHLGPGRTASWSIEMCERHPDIEIIMLDVGSTREDILPPNLVAEIGPFSSGQLNYPDEFFDVVYASLIMQRSKDFGRFLEEAARVLRPSGILMCGEWDSKFYPVQPDVRLQMCIDRDAAYDAAMYAAFPQVMTTVSARNVSANGLGQLVRLTGLFDKVEERRDAIDYTAVSGHPAHVSTGRRFIYSGWEGNREALGLSASDSAAMESLDREIMARVPAGVLSDYYAVVAVKKGSS